MLNDFTMVKDGYICFTGDVFEFYIPEFYEQKRMLEVNSESSSIFAMFNCRVNNNGKQGQLETFNFPSTVEIMAKPEEKRKMDIYGEEETFFVFRIYKNQRIMRDQFQKNSSNVTKFINILTGGKIPKTIPYNQILEIWQRNLAMNGVHLNVAAVVLESIIAQIYRDRNKPQKRFALTIGKQANGDEYNYVTANVRQITSLDSTFGGLTFEDMDQMRIDGINNTVYKKPQSISPIEKIIKM